MSCCYGVPSCSIPTCSIPTCPPPRSPVCYPVGSLGSLSSCGGSGLSSGGSGGAVSSRSLGIIPGASIGCVNQLPPSEIVVQPAPICVTIPGAVLSASCEPTRVGGYTACGGGSSGGSSGGYVISGGSLGGGSSSSKVCYMPC